MTEHRMDFVEALSKMITKDMEGHPEWGLTYAARIDASAALHAAAKKKDGMVR